MSRRTASSSSAPRSASATGCETHEGDWTDWWADGIGSGARALGFNRLAQGAVRSGQTLHALADALGQPEPEWPAEADRAYASMALFDEHTWGAANPWEDGLERMASGGLQWRRKESFALDAYDRATRLLEAGAERLARAVSPGPRAELGAVVVLNTRGSARTELVRAFVPFSRVPADVDLTVVDAETGEREPHVVEAQQHERFRPAGHFLSFVARDVPACGFRRYTLVAANAGDATLGDGDPLALETDQLRLELDPAEGFVASLVDLEHGRRELVDAGGAFGFNQYVYDRYSTAPRFNHLSSRIPPGASGRWLLGGRSAARYPVVAERSSNAVWEQVTIRVQAEGAAWLESTYRLVRGQRRLDVSNRLEKIPTDERRAPSSRSRLRSKSPTSRSRSQAGSPRPASRAFPGRLRTCVPSGTGSRLPTPRRGSPGDARGAARPGQPPARPVRRSGDRRARRGWSGDALLVGDEQRLGHELPLAMRRRDDLPDAVAPSTGGAAGGGVGMRPPLPRRSFRSASARPAPAVRPAASAPSTVTTSRSSRSSGRGAGTTSSCLPAARMR